MRGLRSELRHFIGWVAVLIGTWLIAGTLRDALTAHITGASGSAIAIAVGLVLIILAVVFFGRNKPW